MLSFRPNVFLWTSFHWSNPLPILAVSTSLWRILISSSDRFSVTHLQQPLAIGKITFARCNVLSFPRQLSFHLTKFSQNVTPLHRVVCGLHFALVLRVLNSQIPFDDLLFHRQRNSRFSPPDVESPRFNQLDGFVSGCLSGSISETEMYKELGIGLPYSA